MNFLLTVPFTLVYYLLADEEQLSAGEILKESVRLMKGNIGKFIMMEISFLPLMFLSMFTLYIMLLWLLPYMEMTAVEFYRDIRGELQDAPMEPYPPVTPACRLEGEPQKRYIRRDVNALDAEDESAREAYTAQNVLTDDSSMDDSAADSPASDEKNFPGDDFNAEA